MIANKIEGGAVEAVGEVGAVVPIGFRRAGARACHVQAEAAVERARPFAVLSEVPFADGGAVVAARRERFADGLAVAREVVGVLDGDESPLARLAPRRRAHGIDAVARRIEAAHQASARRRRVRRCGVGMREAEAAASQRPNVGRLIVVAAGHLGAHPEAQVRPAKVVGHDEYDVGRRRGEHTLLYIYVRARAREHYFFCPKSSRFFKRNNVAMAAKVSVSDSGTASHKPLSPISEGSATKQGTTSR